MKCYKSIVLTLDGNKSIIYYTSNDDITKHRIKTTKEITISQYINKMLSYN